jgi:hypothetical protein
MLGWNGDDQEWVKHLDPLIPGLVSKRVLVQNWKKERDLQPTPTRPKLLLEAPTPQLMCLFWPTSIPSLGYALDLFPTVIQSIMFVA